MQTRIHKTQNKHPAKKTVIVAGCTRLGAELAQRRKIEKNPADPEYIFTEVGVGYRLASST